MKVKVIKNFVDKNTKDYVSAGDVLDILSERAKELVSDGFVEEAPEKPAETKKPGKSGK